MSDFVYKMNLSAVLTNPPATEEERFRKLAELVARRLNAMVDPMEDRGYIFEASATSELADKFEAFAESDDTSCYPFSQVWDELSDWGESMVVSGRHEKSLCAIPTLPQIFSC